MFSASVNILVTKEVVDEVEVEVIAIGEFAFVSINKLYIVVPEDENSAVAKFVAAMKDFDEVETPEEPDTDSEATSGTESEADTESTTETN